MRRQSRARPRRRIGTDDVQVCDDTGWVCEEHPGQPWRGASKRADASDCRDLHMF
jgi:hypothetical protein